MLWDCSVNMSHFSFLELNLFFWCPPNCDEIICKDVSLGLKFRKFLENIHKEQ